MTAALGDFLCVLSVGVGADPDFEPRAICDREVTPYPMDRMALRTSGPYLRSLDRTAADFEPFAYFQENFGFIPNIFRAQTLRPDVIEAEAHAIDTILLNNGCLTRVQKELILLVVSSANLNTYCVALHCEMLRNLGIPEEQSDQVAIDHHNSRLTVADKALLDFALKLRREPDQFGKTDIDRLRSAGYTSEQVLEGVVMTSLTQFLNDLQMGLGITPDFEPRLVFDEPSKPGPSRDASESMAPNSGSQVDDESDLVNRAKSGDLEAFEGLVRLHQPVLYRILMGITANRQDAEDALQNAFVSAFTHLSQFQGKAKFSTWLTRIAINSRHQLLRERSRGPNEGNMVQVDEFAPRNLRAWGESPEEAFSKEEIRELVETGLLQVPRKYRMPVILRDIEQLSTRQAAEVMNLEEGVLKTRLHRGRLMLREVLSRSLVAPEKGKPLV